MGGLVVTVSNPAARVIRLLDNIYYNVILVFLRYKICVINWKYLEIFCFIMCRGIGNVNSSFKYTLNLSFVSWIRPVEV